MAANARFESPPASASEPAFSGPYSNGKRGGSFREGAERTFSSGFVVTRSAGSAPVASRNLPTLSQCLSFEPIPIGDWKIDRSVELKRVMGLIVGSTSEESSSSLSVAEDLKRLRSSVVDTCNIARVRASKLEEHLHKLDKYCDGVIAKKTQRNELMASDQAGALNSKIGTQIYRNATELVNQRVEDRLKNGLLNKRVRTSVAETRAECRSNGLRKQPVVTAKDRDSLTENDGESDISEERVPRIPAGRDGWDKKMKRKRSVGTASTRSMDNNGEPKRTAQNKAVSEPMLQNELEGPTRDLTGGTNNERILTKGNNKLNTRDDNYIPSGNLVTKGKATRGNRNGVSSSPSTPRLAGTPESWENVSHVTGGSQIPSIGGANDRKRAMPEPSGSSSLVMAQWAGQRPQKISRTRRSNLVSPVSNQEEKSLSSDSCSHSDISGRLASDGTNGPLISKPLKSKLEPVQSPHRLYENKESVDHSSAVGTEVKSVITEESGEDVKRQGRGGRGPVIAKASSLVTGYKLDNTSTVKPIRSNKPGCEKNGSKAGRPLKKLSERKGFSRLGHLQTGGSDCTGKSDDDREELLAAANHARSASYLACSSAFWKKMEPIFAPVSSKDKVYLSTQLKEPDIQESFPQFHGRANNIVMNFTHEVSVYDTNFSGERNMHVKHQGSESFSGRLDSDKASKEFIPLFQRVLSALIIEDTINELEEEENIANIPLQDAFCDTMFQSIHSIKVSFSSNGCTNSFRSPSVYDSPCDDVVLAGISKSFNRPQVIQMEGFGISSFDNQYDQMRLDDKILLELHSIGLYPELVPKLDHKEDETIKQEINQLKTRLRQQNYKKKAYLEKICKSIGSSFVGGDLEQLAMDKLVELAYRKLLATRGPSRGGALKIPKHVAMAFGRRTLARCRKFAKSGVSCFNVAPLRDILFAPQENELETATKYMGFQNSHADSRISSDVAFGINGPISNRGKKKELLLDDISTGFGGTTGKRAYQGERKIKVNSAGQISTSGNGCINQSTRSLHPVQPSLNGPNHNRDVRNGNMPQEMSNESMEIIDPLHDLDPIDELGVGGPQDLSSLLNFDDEELQDHFSAGLEIPLDDLTELNMF
ncbi:hypothetical protein HanRHA438_Chr07g0310531 [Helianthus annuus]|uniref:Uncharacterized protein n=1 Tax=Helianthus annuus TaxID=4232 RepID=A0A251UAY8_HELAN|nr:uncharacterized protein LOC110868223 isoform X2 [Helianthus annuus]KAF5799071.1 hypothetical protein HanXRQr2_Chr07g0300331 [Helianthus annuus]KAJ0563524.1 hypothetical protein HanHA89_Chr07g0264141 [Helianthus annuus]KAJ0731617.1 hypothetical protein HanOQP8_Chr07g0254041 [Helianthus annuus]KAJ0908445.1 hypothetical protein HanRHA438_Chr07g0310531 [Helianthus annuus]